MWTEKYIFIKKIKQTKIQFEMKEEEETWLNEVLILINKISHTHKLNDILMVVVFIYL